MGMMSDIRDVKPPVDLPDFWWVVWVILALIVLNGLIYLVFRFLKSPHKPIDPPPPEISAWEKAFLQLEALRKENLLDRGLFKEFFTRVADITRHYMENRFMIRAPHMSTEEFLYFLGKSGHLNESQKDALKNFLNSCDMVKFAKYAPTIKEATINFDLAKKLVDDTRI